MADEPIAVVVPKDLYYHEVAYVRELEERIAALERRPKLYCAMLTTGVCDQIARAEASEALLAGAREALEDASAQILHDYRTWVADDASAKPRYGQIPRYDAVNATLSRLNPGEKGCDPSCNCYFPADCDGDCAARKAET